MQYSLVLLLVGSAIISCALAENNYLWGEIRENDYQIGKTTVKKSSSFIIQTTVHTTYVFKQKDDLNALTITGIRVTDQKGNKGATVLLKSGGPGSKGATLEFTSQKGESIKDLVEIYGR